MPERTRIPRTTRKRVANNSQLFEPQLPELVKTAMATNIEAFQDTLAGRIDIRKYSNYNKLLTVTARIMKLYNRNPKSSLKNATNDLTPHDVEKAELFWIREAQKNMGKDIENGKYKRLCQKMREDGVYVIRGRSELWMEMNYDKREVILLPYDHPFSCLFVEHKHRIGHHGVLTKASKVSTRYWIPKFLKLVKSIKSKCVIWRKRDKRVSEQVMGNLPTDRLKPASPWYSTGIDLFGPYRLRDTVKKRTTSKTYGVIFTCLGKRAIYLDIAADYGTDKFLMVLTRFVSLHGYYPSKLFSDNGNPTRFRK